MAFFPPLEPLENLDEIEEERRLFYVACTRAKKNLYMLCPEHNRARSYGGGFPGMAFSEPSRFLSEINNLSELTEIWQLHEESSPW